MVTRDTHARIYQHELSKQEYDRVHQLASRQQFNVNELLASSVNTCLKGWGIHNFVEIEEMTVDDEKIRFYLWISAAEHTKYHLVSVGAITASPPQARQVR
jgi:hypothetical protein